MRTASLLVADYERKLKEAMRFTWNDRNYASKKKDINRLWSVCPKIMKLT